MGKRAFDRLQKVRLDRKEILYMIEVAKKGEGRLVPHLDGFVDRSRGYTRQALDLKQFPPTTLNPYIANEDAALYILECALQRCEKAIANLEKKARKELIEELDRVDRDAEEDSV